MAGVNPGGISLSNIGITWGYKWMALLGKHTKLKKLAYQVKNQAKMMILWVNIKSSVPPSWNPIFGTTWLRFSNRPWFLTQARLSWWATTCLGFKYISMTYNPEKKRVVIPAIPDIGFGLWSLTALEWISNFILHFIMDVITYSCWD